MKTDPRIKYHSFNGFRFGFTNSRYRDGQLRRQDWTLATPKVDLLTTVFPTQRQEV